MGGILVAAAPRAAALGDGELCRAALGGLDTAIPAGLMEAVSLVESGRVSQDTGQWVAWPWTVAAGGVGRFYATKAEAVAAVQAMLLGGQRAIDVGCMQIDLGAHPNAFASVDEAFEPSVNVLYAATFLNALYFEMGDWMKAIAAYHSRKPDIGARYLARVTATMAGGPIALAELREHTWLLFHGSELTRFAVKLPRSNPTLLAQGVALARPVMDESWIVVPLPKWHRPLTRERNKITVRSASARK